MKPTSAILLLACLTSALAAAQVNAGPGPLRAPTNNGQDPVSTKQPAWITDPSENGKSRGGVATWKVSATKQEQKDARADAIAALLLKYKLPAGTRVKEFDMWTDNEKQKIYVFLKAW